MQRQLKSCVTLDFSLLSSQEVLNLLNNDEYCIFKKICPFIIDFSTNRFSWKGKILHYQRDQILPVKNVQQNMVKSKFTLFLHHVLMLSKYSHSAGTSIGLSHCLDIS